MINGLLWWKNLRRITWKRSLLDKLKDSIRFQAKRGSESKSQNTRKVWWLSSMSVNNCDRQNPASLYSWQLLLSQLSQCFPTNGSGQEQRYRTLVDSQTSVQVPPLRHGLFLQQPLPQLTSPVQGTILLWPLYTKLIKKEYVFIAMLFLWF